MKCKNGRLCLKDSSGKKCRVDRLELPAGIRADLLWLHGYWDSWCSTQSTPNGHRYEELKGSSKANSNGHSTFKVWGLRKGSAPWWLKSPCGFRFWLEDGYVCHDH